MDELGQYVTFKHFKCRYLAAWLRWMSTSPLESRSHIQYIHLLYTLKNNEYCSNATIIKICSKKYHEIIIQQKNLWITWPKQTMRLVLQRKPYMQTETNDSACCWQLIKVPMLVRIQQMTDLLQWKLQHLMSGGFRLGLGKAINLF